MRSYAETISSSGSGPLVAATSRETAPASGVNVVKLAAVLFALAVMGGATFAAIYFGVDDSHIAPSNTADGAIHPEISIRSVESILPRISVQALASCLNRVCVPKLKLSGYVSTHALT